MRRVRILLLLGLALVATPVEAGSAGARRALRALVASVEARHGVAHRSLVVVPLVTRGAAGGVPLSCSTAGLSWSHAAGAEVTVDARGVAEDRLLPSGLELGEGSERRLLRTPVLASAGSVPTAETVRIAPGGPKESPRSFLALRGPEVRHLLRIAPCAETLGDLLALEGRLAGLAAGVRVTPAALAAAPHLAPERATAKTVLAALPRAYGGTVCGHVVFLGNRPVEVVLAAQPVTYAAYAQACADGLATYFALWEELYGRTGLPPEGEPDWRRFLEVSAERIRALGAASPKRTASPERWTIRAPKASSLGWLLLDAEDTAVWVEAWPDTAPFPAPSREPDGDPEDEASGTSRSGSMTIPYLERLLERLRERRRKAEAGR